MQRFKCLLSSVTGLMATMFFRDVPSENCPALRFRDSPSRSWSLKLIDAPRYDAAGAKSPDWSSKYRSSVEFDLVSVDRLRDERIAALAMLCLRVCSGARLTQCKGEAYCRC
jgi:hypothetical protein